MDGEYEDIVRKLSARENAGFYSKIYHCQNLSVKYLPHQHK